MAALRALVLATATAALFGCGLGSSSPSPADRAPGRLPQAEATIPSVAGAEAESRAIAEVILGASDPVLAATQAGQGLWAAARAYAAASLDDRPLYWLRLATTTHLKADCGANCPSVVEAFDRASRGDADLTFSDDPTALRMLVTGFDPFSLDRNIDQSNPSGVGALRLDGARWTLAGRPVEVEALLFPVRFDAFDAGTVEARLAPLLKSEALALLATVSMGRDHFDLERFPGRRRSSEAPDNAGVLTGASAAKPLVPRLGKSPLEGPEFVEFSLPVTALQGGAGPYEIRDNRRVATLERGTFDAASLGELDGLTAVRGGGGGYLSNEISYRTVRLAQALGSETAVGHIHTPRLEGFDEETLRAITDQLSAMVKSAAEELTKAP
jgi:pyrrolidone-carboxylate peptidase